MISFTSLTSFDIIRYVALEDVTESSIQLIAKVREEYLAQVAEEERALGEGAED